MILSYISEKPISLVKLIGCKDLERNRTLR